MPDFLLEIGTEEIPARMLDAARAELAQRVGDLLTRERLAQATQIKSYATPRRLAVLVRHVLAAQPDAEETVNGPAVKVAFKDGAPTPAAEAFAKRVGKLVDELKTVTTPKGEYLSATVTQKGRAALDVLSEALPKEIAGIYWPKSMYWRPGKPERFVRPMRWLMALLDDQIVPFEFGGVQAGRATRGHRLLSSAPEITIGSPAEYESAMEQGRIVADPQKRREQLVAQLEAAASAKGLRIRQDEELLDTVVNLTESPSVILGTFEDEYLKLPEEVLVTVMRDHQKYFAIEDASGKLAPHFLAVLNTQADAEAQAIITHGNARVLRARFNDARFFWNTDQRIPLLERGIMLDHVTFQKDLGSYAKKTERMRQLVTWMAQQLSGIDAGAAETAATLAKTDLTTELVKEFTELQGIVGGLYARAQGHTDAVATAIYDHYKPLSIESDAPRTKEGALVAIADKADSIAGMFALGLIPSSSKDPFALRRAANGIVKTIAAHELPISLSALMSTAFHAYDGSEAHARFRVSEAEFNKDVAKFFQERLEFYLKDALGFAYDVVNAVLAVDFQDVTDAELRTAAVAEVRTSPDFEAISLSFKRIKNILRQAGEKGVRVASTDEFHPAALIEPQEQQLAREVETISTAVRSARERKDYQSAVREIAKIRPSLDLFFDKVMVMVEDESLRAQRLALLSRLIAEFSTIADFSEIVAERA
jgi:glycyl-tRNA synthetase beta chain